MLFSISLVAENIFQAGGMPITNSLFTTWIGIIIVSCIVFFGCRKLKIKPRGLQSVLEELYLFFENLCESVLGDKKTARKAVPFIATIFIFVFSANIFEIIPGVGSIGFFETVADGRKLIPLFRPGSSDLNFTIALAIISVIATQIVGLKTLGLGYLKKFFNFSNPLQFFVGLLELVSEFAKIISFSFRLFGNIFAGEVLLAVFLMLIPYLVPVPFYGLELFVSVVQAFVFAMLTLVFMKVAMVPHSGEAH